jgi:hypothetical protein
MSPERERDLLERRAVVLESRLERDIDALARRRPVEIIRSASARKEWLRHVAIGAIAGVVTLVVALFAIKRVRSPRAGSES